MKPALALACLLAFALTSPPLMSARAKEVGPAPPTGQVPQPPPQPKQGAEGGEEGSSGGKSKKPTDISGGRFAGDPVFVHIAPMTVPIITDAGVEQLVTIQLAVEITDLEVADDIHSNMPRVMDALMRALYGGLGKGSLRDGKLVDINKVKIKTTAALNEVLGAGKIHDVLVEGVSQRML